jgi:alanine or glycine:cation symporter, AGCS family
METIESLTEQFVATVWGLPLVFMLVGSGIFFSFYFGFPQIRYFWHAINVVRGKYDRPEDKGEISHFQALTTALSATVGLGNIAGVAIAISLGGPGAVFWLWVAGFMGMCTKFVEVTLSLRYRDITPEGRVHGGPMFVIKNALPKNFYPLAWFYSFFVILSSIGAGNMFQSNQMANVMQATTGMPNWASGLIFSTLAFLVLIGGIKRIGQITSKLVPSMVGLYFLGAIIIILSNLPLVPELLYRIVHDAFNGTAAIGGFTGVAVKEVLIMGIRRASFSNEAGMGSAAMAHSAAKSTPVQEGVVSLLEPFIDTIIVCTMTAMAILITNVWINPDIAGSEMTAAAFETVLGPTGRWIVTITVTLFAFSTMISWSYYGEQGVTFIAGEKFIPLYRYVFVTFIFIGAILQLTVVLNISDGFYGLLAIPNLIACYFLLPKLKEMVGNYDFKTGQEK